MKHQWEFVPVTPLNPDNDHVPGLMLKKGDAVILDEVWNSVLDRDKEGVLFYVKDGSKLKKKYTNAELFAFYFAGRLQIKRETFGKVPEVIAGALGKPPEAYKQHETDEALRRLTYCQITKRMQKARKVNRRPDGYARAARVTAYLMRRQKASELKLPRSAVGLEYVGGPTLRDWYLRWESSGYRLAALYRQDCNKGVKGCRLNPEVVAVARKHICERYLTLEGPPLSAVHHIICSDVRTMNKSRDELNQLHEPSIDSVSNWLNENFDEFDIVLARKGPKIAAEQFRQIKRAPAGLWPMHTVEIDYTWLDCFCIDDRNNPINGTWAKSRPWIIAAICTLTRMIVGFYITFEPPSWESVMHCLRHMVLPKRIDPRYGIQSPYPCFGVCKVLRMDNERAFRSRSMELAAGSLGFVPDYGPAGQSRLRGKIERWFRTMNEGAFAFVPGKSFSNPGKRGDYPSEARATYTYKDIVRHLTIWIVDVYHNTPHGGLIGMTPLQKWDAVKEIGVDMPDSVEDLDAVLALSIERTVQRDGIRFLGLRYQSKELQKFLERRNGKGQKYIIKVDPFDLSILPVFNDMDEKWIYVPCTTPELVEDVSLPEWKQACILARQMNGGNSPSRQILQEALRRLGDEAARKGARPVKRMQFEDLDWYRENPDDLVFENTIDDDIRKSKRSHKAKTHGTAPEIDASNADVISSAGPVLLPAPAPVDEIPYAEEPTLPDHGAFDPHDPKNWGGPK